MENLSKQDADEIPADVKFELPSDEVMLDFIDWFGTWQTDKNLDDYGINDVLDDYKEYHKRRN